MKSKLMTHPRLYFDFQYHQDIVKLSYLSNQLDQNGKRIKKVLHKNVSSFSNHDLILLNQEEYKNLLIYIMRQEKVLNIYERKDQKEKYNIVKSSLSLMYELKIEFDVWFKSNSINFFEILN